MLFPTVNCPCGFAASGPDAAKLYQEHTCPKPPANWATAAAMIALFAGIVLIVWAGVWGATQ